MERANAKGIPSFPDHLLDMKSDEGISLTLPQVFLVMMDILIEAVWPLTLMITLEDGEYPYDPFVMQAMANGVACICIYCVDWMRVGHKPSWAIGWRNFTQGAGASLFYNSGLILLMTGFKSASSGAAATCGFLALPIFVFVVMISAAITNNVQEWHEVEMKLSGVTTELLLIITTCATLFILNDKASAPQGIFLLLLGRCFICIKSYINGLSVGNHRNVGTVSEATTFLACMAVIMYVSSQPASFLVHGSVDWSHLLPLTWTAWTLIPFFSSTCMYITNTLVETTVSGEMQAITGMSGRMLAMYISFVYDVIPTSAIVLSVVTITLSVIAYMRLHYRYGGSEPQLMNYFMLNGRKPLNFAYNNTF